MAVDVRTHATHRQARHMPPVILLGAMSVPALAAAIGDLGPLGILLFVTGALLALAGEKIPLPRRKR